MIDFKVNVLRRGGVFKTLLWPADSPPTIRFDSDALIKGSLSGSFIYDSEVDLSKDELQPWLIKDGENIPLGIYRIASGDHSGGSGSELMRLEAYDRCYILSERKTESFLFYASGRKYMDIILGLLADCGIGRFQADDSDAVLATDREDWDVGTSYLEIINQLLDEIGFDPLFFDSYGIAVLRRYRPPSAGEIVRNYSASDLRRTPMAPDWVQETDLFDAPNVFILICSNADRSGTLMASAVNDSPLSAKSVINRGLRITEVKKINQTAGQTELQTAANRLRDQSLLSAYTISISVPPEGGHSMGDTVSVDHPRIGGIYREKGWQLALKSGELLKLDLQKEVLK